LTKTAVAVVAVTEVQTTVSAFVLVSTIETTPTPIWLMLAGVTVTVPGDTAVPRVVGRGYRGVIATAGPATIMFEYRAYPGRLPQVPVIEICPGFDPRK
jgi:hypothetical protein